MHPIHTRPLPPQPVDVPNWPRFAPPSAPPARAGDERGRGAVCRLHGPHGGQAAGAPVQVAPVLLRGARSRLRGAGRRRGTRVRPATSGGERPHLRQPTSRAVGSDAGRAAAPGGCRAGRPAARVVRAPPLVARAVVLSREGAHVGRDGRGAQKLVHARGKRIANQPPRSFPLGPTPHTVRLAPCGPRTFSRPAPWRTYTLFPAGAPALTHPLARV